MTDGNTCSDDNLGGSTLKYFGINWSHHILQRHFTGSIIRLRLCQLNNSARRKRGFGYRYFVGTKYWRAWDACKNTRDFAKWLSNILQNLLIYNLTHSFERNQFTKSRWSGNISCQRSMESFDLWWRFVWQWLFHMTIHCSSMQMPELHSVFCTVINTLDTELNLWLHNAKHINGVSHNW